MVSSSTAIITAIIVSLSGSQNFGISLDSPIVCLNFLEARNTV